MTQLNLTPPDAARPAPEPTEPGGLFAHACRSHPLWQLGFRPFYLLAALFAAIAVPLWLMQYLQFFPGAAQFPAALHVDLLWHMHEMVFGFALAVIIGFLMTAMRNWTGLWTPRHAHLAALCGLWLAGRLAMLLATPQVAALIDLAFLPLATWPLYVLLRSAGNRRNLFLIGLLAMLTLCNLAFHAARLGWVPANILHLYPVLAIQAAIFIIVVIESVIGARVIPMFTANGAPGSAPQVSRLRDRIALVLTVATALGWLFGLPGAALATLSLATASAVLLRVLGWQPQRTIGIPLLWILHLSYGWIALGFVLLALAALNLVTLSSAFHALTVGSMAGLILGMITRTTLGHTGRALVAGRAELVMYSLIQLGALARVLAAFATPTWRTIALCVSALAWSGAFLLYLAVYAPYLWRARIDGREG